MKVYDSEHIRNLALVGHGASGKTTLVNAMAWQAGSCGRMGSVGQGNALTDFTPDEVEHQISINVALAYAEQPDLHLTISVGIAELDPALPEFEVMLAAARDALGKAKLDGRNRVVAAERKVYNIKLVPGVERGLN